MKLAFRETVAAALPSAEQLRARLDALPGGDWSELAALFSAGLPELDAVVALPGGELLARALAHDRGIPLLEGLSAATGTAVSPPGEVALVTGYLTDGLAELEALLRAEGQGLRVRVVAAAIECTNAPGRTRLELQDMRVLAAVQLADTPEGLAFERRIPHPWPRVS
ncbi:hypothetical protein Dcar01_00305 [Deinococcus carri]|uniref:Uncharacterized protein n=1 Tax=Deinococcus carri TaxID=1211323 RepID=A0ABP9W2K7_9DEIO